jgi:hypothetical protein
MLVTGLLVELERQNFVQKGISTGTMIRSKEIIVSTVIQVL